jgi:hypothetical protein
MNRDEVIELAAGYALGSLEVEDRARFEALLAAGDAEARAALRDFESTVVELAAETVEAAPPAAVKAALLARIDAEGRSRVLSAARPAPRRRSLWTMVTVGAMAAAIAAIAVGLAVSAVYDRRISQLAQEQAQLKEELTRQGALVTILQDPATRSSRCPVSPPRLKPRLAYCGTRRRGGSSSPRDCRPPPQAKPMSSGPLPARARRCPPASSPWTPRGWGVSAWPPSDPARHPTRSR